MIFSSRVIVLHHPNPLVNPSGVDTQPLEVTLTSVHSLLPSLSLPRTTCVLLL
jgi:hypothetical protein